MRKRKKKEATLLSFKVVLDTKGTLWTEVGGLPVHEVSKCFKNKDDAYLITKLINEGAVKLDRLNKYLESELVAINYVE
tara:strand:+ start:14283 stop:14519 length:237 start_codon:yes stop_codon:yes gene_type:complete